MKFYTFLDNKGTTIFHRYVENGKHHQEVINGFPIELFMESEKEPDAFGLMGEKLKRVEFSDIKEAKNFIDEYKDVTKIYGQTSIIHQFITKTYPNEITFDINDVIIANIDIETAFGKSEYDDDHMIKTQDSKTMTLSKLKTLSDCNNVIVWDEKLNEYKKYITSCYAPIGGFPKPELANQEILSISLKCFGDKNNVTWGLKPYTGEITDDFEYIHCNSEKELLNNFVEYWNKLKPEILVGWNCTGFDVPYIINRMNKIIGEDRTRRLSPFHLSTKRVFDTVTVHNDQSSYNILGITIYDYMDLYKKYGGKVLEKYSLDHVSYVELNERKLDYSEYTNLMDLYNKDFNRYIRYNRHDVELVERLDNKLKFIVLALTLTYMAKVKLDEIFGQVKFWDVFIYNHLYKKNIQISPQKFSSDDSRIEGGFVKDPIPGLYKWVITMDLTSLYPSNILQNNLSPETLVSGARGNLVDKMLNKSYNTHWLKADDVCMTANGATFTRKKLGMMPEIVQTLFNNRRDVKKEMLKTSREIESIKKEMSKRGIAL